GTIINFDADAAQWDHAWRVSFTGNQATLRRGLVDGLEPKINGRFMSGDQKNPDPPRLPIAPSRFSSQGMSLICVEIECDEHWNTKTATIVQVARLNETENTAAMDESNRPLL